MDCMLLAFVFVILLLVYYWGQINSYFTIGNDINMLHLIMHKHFTNLDLHTLFLLLSLRGYDLR